MATTTRRKKKTKKTGLKQLRQAKNNSTVLYIRNLRGDVAMKIKAAARARRQTTAGVIMDLVKTVGPEYFETDYTGI